MPRQFLEAALAMLAQDENYKKAIAIAVATTQQEMAARYPSSDTNVRNPEAACHTSALEKQIRARQTLAVRFLYFDARPNHDKIYDFALDTQGHEFGMTLAACRGLHEFIMQITADDSTMRGCPYCVKRIRGEIRADVVKALRDAAGEVVNQCQKELGELNQAVMEQYEKELEGLSLAMQKVKVSIVQ